MSAFPNPEDPIFNPHAIEERFNRHEKWIQDLEDDVREIKMTLGLMATKDDLNVAFSKVETKIEASINGILREALNAQPVRQSAMWAGLLFFITVGSVIIALVH